MSIKTKLKKIIWTECPYCFQYVYLKETVLDKAMLFVKKTFRWVIKKEKWASDEIVFCPKCHKKFNANSNSFGYLFGSLIVFVGLLSSLFTDNYNSFFYFSIGPFCIAIFLLIYSRLTLKTHKLD